MPGRQRIFTARDLVFRRSLTADWKPGQRQRASYALSQGKANFILTTPMTPDDPAAEHIRKHGDGVRDIALEVDDADQAFAEAVRRGAQPAEEPHDIKDEHGTIRRAAVHTYGDTIHSLISYKDYKGPFLPGFMAAPLAGDDCGILRIDHIVGNVELGKMQYWADYYTRVFGFHRYITFDDKDISTEYSALMSIVMSDDSHSVKFPINEPATARNKSQIQEYIEAYGGPGAQHIALQCKDVLYTVGKLQRNGLDFLRVPDTYYDAAAVAGRTGGGTAGRVALAGYTCGPRRRRLPAADFLEAGGGSSDGVLRGHSAQGQPRIWQREFQSAV